MKFSIAEYKIITMKTFFLSLTITSFGYGRICYADLDDLDPVAPKPAEQLAPISNEANKSVSKKTIPSNQKPLASDKKEETKKPGKKIQTKPEKSGRDEPIKWKSKSLKAVKEKGTIELNEDVEVTQADLQLNSQNAKIFRTEDQKEVEKVIVTGNVKITRSSTDPEEQIIGTGNEAVFFNSERKIILKGNAKLIRGSDILRGKQISYELDTGWISVDNVEGVMQPSEKDKAKKMGK